jgi:hypothetical protein
MVACMGCLMCPPHLYSFIYYLTKVILCFLFICMHGRILDMFVCYCDKVRKAAEQVMWMLFGQCDKGHMLRKISFCEFLIPSDVRLITQHFTMRSSRWNRWTHLLIGNNTVKMYTTMSALWCVLLQTSKKLNCIVSELSSFHSRLSWTNCVIGVTINMHALIRN